MIHAVLIAFNNPEQTKQRWERDVLPALDVTACPYAVTCVDNSQEKSALLEDQFGEGYLWQGGNNLRYGPSVNLAAKRVESYFTLYACSRHGRMVDPTWVCDLLRPFRDPKVGASGYLVGSNSPEGVAHATGREWVKETYRFVDDQGQGYVPQHVQGGVFLARTRALLENPYPDDVPHLYTDHLLTWAFLKAGWKCVNVPTVLSVWREKLTHDRLQGIKYFHDESEENFQYQM